MKPLRSASPGQTRHRRVWLHKYTGRFSLKIPRILLGLMGPMLMMVLNATMFGVALPELRATFNIRADITAWLVTAYVLPFVVFMPLYGRLGDGLGKRRLFLIGITVFMVGTTLCLLAGRLPVLILGRMIQGIGAAGVNPLSIALISEWFPAGERGKALGTWNSLGPVAAMIGPTLGGFLVDVLSWRAIFAPVLLVGVIAATVVIKLVPAARRQFVQPGFLRRFDWVGVLLLSATTVAGLFFVSSRPITGVAALQDWRLLVAAAFSFGLFLAWERRRADPFVRLSLFRDSGFSRASLGAASRMFTLSTVFFLIPLYLTDVYHLSASSIGGVLMLHGAALFVTMRWGGQLADQGGSHRPVMIGAAVQAGAIIYLAFLPGTLSPLWVIVGLVGNGMGAGLYLAPLHRAAMSHVAPDQMGMAAGLYSMLRFAGSALGAALAGVLLQFGLDRQMPPIQAYRLVFLAVAVVAVSGIIAGHGLRE